MAHLVVVVLLALLPVLVAQAPQVLTAVRVCQAAALRQGLAAAVAALAARARLLSLMGSEQMAA
jgi:hypothetical protein